MNNIEKQYSEQVLQIAKIMRTTRKTKGFTQSEIAKSIGVSQGTLSKIEQGALVVSAPIWFKYCGIVKISPNSFLKN